MASKKNGSATRRMTLRLPEETVARAEFWAGTRTERMSLAEYIGEALEEKISRDAGKIPDVDNLIVNRLNQLIELNTALTSEVSNLHSVFGNAMDSFMAMGRGANILIDEEDGELYE